MPFLAEALGRLTAAVSDVLDARWVALAPDQVAAAVRALHREHARLDAAVLRSVKAVDDRDDVVPRAKAAGASFLPYALGIERQQAHRDAEAARLLDADTGDLRGIGAAYAAGRITRHVDLATAAHRRLGAAVRDTLVPVVDPDTGQVADRRCIEVVDPTLARQAQALSVTEFQRVIDRLIEHLNRPSPEGAHERRYLHLSRLPDGSLIGRFACGPAQALALTAVIAAGVAPQPGTAIDADGVGRVLPDERTAAQRRMDALVAAVQGGTDTTGTNGARSVIPDAEPGEGDPLEDDPLEDDPGEDDPGEDAGASSDPDDRLGPEAESDPEPHPEGEYQVRKAPGVRTGRYPNVEILVSATLEQLAMALTHESSAASGRS